MKGYRTLAQPGEAEIIINKSRFIGRGFPVESEEEALGILADIRKRHWDATHNCYAYRIEGGAARFSDDGEPGGTAGLPMMEVLNARDISNALVVVTRYFGGVLLGAGGLVRAYSRSAAEAVNASGTALLKPALRYSLRVDYSRYGGLEGYVRSAAQVEAVEFGEDVCISALVDEGAAEAFIKEVTERTDGRCRPQAAGEGCLRVTEI